MEREEMLDEIDNILSVPEQKQKVDRIVPLLHGKWELQVMLEICRFEVVRFGMLKKRFPNITNSVLSSVLRNLERWKLIERTQYNVMPPRVDYTPTEKGEASFQFAMRSFSGVWNTGWMNEAWN